MEEDNFPSYKDNRHASVEISNVEKDTQKKLKKPRGHL